jgi:hypothetical protein
MQARDLLRIDHRVSNPLRAVRCAMAPLSSLLPGPLLCWGGQEAGRHQVNIRCSAQPQRQLLLLLQEPASDSAAQLEGTLLLLLLALMAARTGKEGRWFSSTAA